LLPGKQENQSHGDEHRTENDGVQNRFGGTAAKSKILWLHLITLHVKWGRQSRLSRNRSESQLGGLAVNSAGDEFFEESSATFPCKLSDALVSSMRQTDSQVVVA
jgi:hypothetical protein